MSAAAPSWLDRVMVRWADVVVGWPKLVLAVGLLLAVAGGLVGQLELAIDTDQDELVSSGADYYLRYKKDYLGNFQDTEYLYVAIEVKGDPARARQLAQAFTTRALAVPGVEFARWALDLSALDRWPLHLQPEADIAATASGLMTARDDLRALRRAQGLADVLEHASERTMELALGGRGEEAGDRTAFRFLDGLLADIDRALRNEPVTGEAGAAFVEGPDGGDPASRDPLVPLFDTDPRQDPGGREAKFLFVALQVRRDFTTLAVIEEPLRGLRAALDEAKVEVPGLEAGLTGRPVLAADEMISTSEDMTVATSVAFVCVAILYMLALRSIWRPLLIMAALAVGTAWTFGFAWLAVGSLNLLSIVFTVILIGLGGDYGIHIVARYGEALAAGLGVRDAARQSLLGTGRGNITACAATAAAFLCTQLVDFRGLAELGLIAGGGMLLCLVAQQTVLVAGLVLLEPHLGKSRTPRAPFQYRALGALDRWPRAMAAVALLVTAALVWPATRLRFDTDLLGLQDPTLDSVCWEKRVTAESTFSTWFAVFLADDLDGTRALVERLRARPDLFARVESVLDLLPPPGRQQALERLAAALDPASFERRDCEPLPREPAYARAEAARLRDAAGELAGFFAKLRDAARGARVEPDALAALDGLAAHAGAVRDQLDLRVTAFAGGASPEADDGWRRLSGFQVDFLTGLGRFVDDVLRPKVLGPDDLPHEVRQRFVGDDGHFAVLAFPVADLWTPASLEAFHRDVVALDPAVTGVPVMVQRSVNAMREGFVVAFGYAALVVVFFVAIDLRRPRALLLALLPVALGLAWTAGLASLIGLRPNLANFFAVPMLLGIAIDNGVHLIHRWLEDPEHNPAVGTTGAAIVLTGLTNIVGLGALAFAGHRGLASLGLLLALGTGVCVVSALVIVPPLLRRWARPTV